MKDNKTMIQNVNAKFMINEKKSIIPLGILKKCKRETNLTICKSIIQEILTKEEHTCGIYSEEKCNYKHIRSKNYIIETSNNSVYCYILNPMQIKISCMENEKILNLTGSTEIFFDDFCDLNKVTNNQTHNQTYFEFKIKNNYIKPNLTRYNNETKEWINFEKLNRYQIEYLKEYKDIQELEKTMEDFIKSSNSTTFNIFGGIFSFVKNTFYKIILGTAGLVIVPLFLSLLVYCICRRLSN